MIYVHIPYCRGLCSYCDFYHLRVPADTGSMVDALSKELIIKKDFLGEEPIQTIYIGGGTPSVLPTEQLEGIVETIRRNFDISQLQEFTVECNPEDITTDYCHKLLEIGVNRLSMGCQSFNDDTLKMMLRRHTAAESIEAVKTARRAGFTNITIDLIFGVPGVSDEMLQFDIETALSLDVQHISAYHLSIEQGTVLAKRVKEGVIKEVPDDTSLRQYAIVEELLTAAGYIHYEVSNYAREGYRAVHNSNYWRGKSYLGVGPSAHSFDGASRYCNISSERNYLKAINEGGEYQEIETLSENDRYNEFIMTRLRTCEGLELSKLERLFGEKFATHFAQESERFKIDGSLASSQGRIYIPSSNFLISDYIISNLFI